MIWLIFGAVIVWAIFFRGKNKTQLVKSQTVSSRGNYPEVSFSYGTSQSYNKLQADPSKVWIRKGPGVVVGRHKIDCELLYLGTELSSIASTYTAEPALVNTSLTLENADGKTIPEIGYWPSYTNLLPIQRDAYLSWLSTGRKSPDANIGFVFLYFYGLERRALVDLGIDDRDGEIKFIIDEVNRLREIYKANKSFDSYSFNLLQALQVVRNSQKFYQLPVITKKFGYDMPLLTRAALGQLVAENLPIPPEWAYAWVITSPNYFPKTPAHRCPYEHEKLFHIKYVEKYGSGLVVKPGKSLLKFEYRAATRSFSSAQIDCLDLPDVLAGKATLNKLVAISDSCCEDLNEYSRYIGRKKSDANSLQAKSLLPAALVNKEVAGSAIKLKLFIESTFGHGEATRTLTTKELSANWPNSPATLTKSDALALSGILEKWGFGIEPDLRFKTSALEKSDKCVVFRLGDNKMSESVSPQYKLALFVLRLAALLANSSSSAGAKQEDIIFSYLRGWVHLSPAELNRLKNHFTWLKTLEVKITGFKKEIEAMSVEQKSAIKQFLIGVAAYDGHIEPTEIESLKRVYKLLEFDEKDLFGELHAAVSDISDQPVKVATAAKSKAYRIPKNKGSNDKVSANEFSLDIEEIGRKLEASSKVFEILNDVFKDDDALNSTISSEQVESSSGALDDKHSKFLTNLASKSHWDRHEIDDLAKNLGLFADGALERINEYAFERYDQPAWEGQDPIEINLEIFKVGVA